MWRVQATRAGGAKLSLSHLASHSSSSHSASFSFSSKTISSSRCCCSLRISRFPSSSPCRRSRSVRVSCKNSSRAQRCLWAQRERALKRKESDSIDHHRLAATGPLCFLFSPSLPAFLRRCHLHEAELRCSGPLRRARKRRERNGLRGSDRRAMSERRGVAARREKAGGAPPFSLTLFCTPSTPQPNPTN